MQTGERSSLSALAVMAFCLALLAVMTFERNSVWNSKLSLWMDVAKKSPLKSRAHNNVGNCYMLLGKPFEAIAEYKTAVQLDPSNIEAYYNLGLNLEDVGILNQAAYYYDIFCKSAPPDYREQQLSSCQRVLLLSKRMYQQ